MEEEGFPAEQALPSFAAASVASADPRRSAN
jgi:hypothetical protein